MRPGLTARAHCFWNQRRLIYCRTTRLRDVVTSYLKEIATQHISAVWPFLSPELLVLFVPSFRRSRDQKKRGLLRRECGLAIPVHMRTANHPWRGSRASRCRFLLYFSSVKPLFFPLAVILLGVDFEVRFFILVVVYSQ